LRQCRSIRSSASGLPYYCTPLVCVSDVIYSLAVWRHNKPKTKRLSIPPSHPLIPSDQTSPMSSSPGLDHWGGTPPLDHGRAAAKPTIGARQRRICLSLCSPLPALCFAKTSPPALHPHNTLACNHTTLPPPPRPHLCTP